MRATGGAQVLPVAHRAEQRTAVAPQPWPVMCLGATARAALSASRRGRVLAVMSQAVYLESEAGELVWLATDATPMHGRCLSLGCTLPTVSEGVAYEVLADALWFEDGISLAWAGASIWQAPTTGDVLRFGPGNLARRLESARPSLETLPPPRGFGLLLAPILDRPSEGAIDPAVSGSSRTLWLALPSIENLCDALHGGDVDGALVHAEPLLGLGEGLTPSGDDFIGGMLFGISLLEGVRAPLGRLSSSALERFLTIARHRTNRISFALLRDHAVGQASEPVHHYVRAVLRGDPQADLDRLIADVVRLGHSTGWDTLAGLWTALWTLVDDARSPSG
jgi:hypothetical protein